MSSCSIVWLLFELAKFVTRVQIPATAPILNEFSQVQDLGIDSDYNPFLIISSTSTAFSGFGN